MAKDGHPQKNAPPDLTGMAEQVLTQMEDMSEDLPSPENIQAQLGNVASGLAEQLTTITQEMNKIREELYGEGGIGGIAKELAHLKEGGLADLLDAPEMTAALGDRSSGSAGSGGRASPPQSAAGKQATATTGAGGEVRQRKVLSEERERRLEEMRDKLQSRKAKEQEDKQSQSGGIAEMVLLVFSVIAMAYAFSASFRSFVKTIVMDTFFPGQVVDGDDGQDSWGVVEDEGEAFF